MPDDKTTRTAAPNPGNAPSNDPDANETVVTGPDPDANETVAGGKYLDADGKTLVDANGEPLGEQKAG